MRISPILGLVGGSKLIFIYMTIQGTSTKINFIPIGVYLAILIIHIIKSVKFWQVLYEEKNIWRADSPKGQGGASR